MAMSQQLQYLRLINIVDPGQFLWATWLPSLAGNVTVWPELLSLEISGYHQEQINKMRRATWTKVIGDHCPKLDQFRLVVFVWRKPNHGRTPGEFWCESVVPWEEDFVINIQNRCCFLPGDEW